MSWTSHAGLWRQDATSRLSLRGSLRRYSGFGPRLLLRRASMQCSQAASAPASHSPTKSLASRVARPSATHEPGRDQRARRLNRSLPARQSRASERQKPRDETGLDGTGEPRASRGESPLGLLKQRGGGIRTHDRVVARQRSSGPGLRALRSKWTFASARAVATTSRPFTARPHSGGLHGAPPGRPRRQRRRRPSKPSAGRRAPKKSWIAATVSGWVRTPK